MKYTWKGPGHLSIRNAVIQPGHDLELEQIDIERMAADTRKCLAPVSQKNNQVSMESLQVAGVDDSNKTVQVTAQERPSAKGLSRSGLIKLCNTHGIKGANHLSTQAMIDQLTALQVLQ